MIIKSISGKTIYISHLKSLRASLEEGVAKGVDFSFADLRKARLTGASLDGLVAVGATLWGADLDNADIGLADLRKADLRCASLKDTCLAETDLSGADLRGAYFSDTVLEQAVLDRCRISCPSFWRQDIAGAKSLAGALFSHRGEEEMEIDCGRWLLDSGGQSFVMNGDVLLWRGKLYRGGLPPSARPAIRSLQLLLQRFLDADFHNANKPIPKRKLSAKGI